MKKTINKIALDINKMQLDTQRIQLGINRTKTVHLIFHTSRELSVNHLVYPVKRGNICSLCLYL
jgi:hypothetical protein